MHIRLTLTRRTLVVAAGGLFLVAVLVSSCGGGEKQRSGAQLTPANTSSRTQEASAQPTIPPQAVTATVAFVETAVAEFRNVPVISQASAPGWQEEGEPGAKQIGRAHV